MPDKNKDATQLFDGTVSAPSLAFTGDQDTGLYRPSANVVGIAAAGVQVVKVDGNTASAATGVSVTSAAAGSRVAVAALSSGTNEGIDIDAKGSGTIRLGNTSTGDVVLSRSATVAGTVTITSANASAFTVGRLGATTPALHVDASAATSITGIKVSSAASGGGVAVAAIGETNINTTIDAAGSGTLTLNGTATGNVISGTGLTSKHATAGLGYSTGAGGAVTQITNASTGVTLNKVCGQITTVALTTAAAAEEVFTVTNSAVAATDAIALGTTYAGGGTPAVTVKAVAAGSFQIVITNLHASAALDAVLVINFAVIKGVTS